MPGLRVWTPLPPTCGRSSEGEDTLPQNRGLAAGPHGATLTHMERIGIREARQHLSRYASRVRAGESFVITDRGEEVARLVPPASRMTALDRLVTERGARRASGSLSDLAPPLAPAPDDPSMQSILDDLREERV